MEGACPLCRLGYGPDHSPCLLLTSQFFERGYKQTEAMLLGLHAGVKAGILHRIMIIFIDHAWSLIIAWRLSGRTFFVNNFCFLNWIGEGPRILRTAHVMSVSVCLSACMRVCVFVCPRSYIRNYMSDLHQFFVHVTYSRGSVLFWRRSVVYFRFYSWPHVCSRLLDVAAHLKRIAHAALGLAINCAQ